MKESNGNKEKDKNDIIESIRTNLNLLIGAYTNLENSVANLENSVASLENSATSLGNSVTGLENSVDSIHVRSTTFEGISEDDNPEGRIAILEDIKRRSKLRGNKNKTSRLSFPSGEEVHQSISLPQFDFCPVDDMADNVQGGFSNLWSRYNPSQEGEEVHDSISVPGYDPWPVGSM